MPSSLREYQEKEQQAALDFFEDSLEKAVKGDSSKLFSTGVYIHGAVVALIAGVAVLL